MTIGGFLRKHGKAEIKKIKFGKKRKALIKAPKLPKVPKLKRKTDPIARAKKESQKRRNQIGIKSL